MEITIVIYSLAEDRLLHAPARSGNSLAGLLTDWGIALQVHINKYIYIYIYIVYIYIYIYIDVYIYVCVYIFIYIYIYI